MKTFTNMLLSKKGMSHVLKQTKKGNFITYQ